MDFLLYSQNSDYLILTFRRYLLKSRNLERRGEVWKVLVFSTKQDGHVCCLRWTSNLVKNYKLESLQSDSHVNNIELMYVLVMRP